MIEVIVRRGRQPYLRKTLPAGTATVGSDKNATIALISQRVSQVHFELEVSSERVRVADAGSRNGMKVNGKRVKRAEIKPGDVVAVPGFRMIYRRLDRAGEGEKHESIGGGWDDYLEDGDFDAATDPQARAPTSLLDRKRGPMSVTSPRSAKKGAGGILASSEATFASTAGAKGQHLVGDGSQTDRRSRSREVTQVTTQPNTISESRPESELDDTGSVLNYLAQQRATGKLRRPFRVEDLEDWEEDEIELLTPPDIEPLILRLRDEANSLLYGTNEGELAVEVIETLGEQINRMALLSLGETFWWGGRPGWFEEPTRHCFPLVAYPMEREFLVQRPDDPHWRVFYRGEGGLEVDRIAGLISHVAQWDDQVEVRYGPYSLYIRCVRRPVSVGQQFPLQKLLPSKYVWLGFLGSLLLHAAFTALPAPKSINPFERGGFVRPLARDPEFVFVAEELQLEPPPAPTKSEPPPEPEGRRGRRLGAEIKGPALRPDPEPVPLAEPEKPEPAEPMEQSEPPEESPEAQTEPFSPKEQISIATFKITGMIGHLPELHFESSRAARGSHRVLHGGTGVGLVSKATGQMGITPTGNLSKNAVSKVVNARTGEVYLCYQELLNTHPTAEGRIDLWWTVDEKGRVGMVRVLSDSVGATNLVGCLRGAVRKWVFPPPQGGPALVTFPFTFRRPEL